jgi:plastocyanin
VTDLVVTRGSGALVLWKGVGGADFSSDLVDTGPHAHDAHAGHHPISAEPAPLAHEALERVQAALAIRSVRSDLEDSDSEVAWITDAGRLEAKTATGRVDVPLPPGFVARLLASGRLGPDGGFAIAVIGQGSRPRLVIAMPTSSSKWQVHEVLSPTTTFNVQVAQSGFSFSPSTVTLEPGDTVHWIWVNSGHTVTSGNTTTCTVDNQFCSPSNTSCSTAATSNAGATYDHTFPSAGTFPYFCRPHCSSGMKGTVNVQVPTAPGAVPDRAPGVPLTLSKGAPPDLIATWGASCSPAATAYGIYQGSLPIAAYDHTMLVCPAGTATTATFTPGSGDEYFLVVPRTATAEGSYGKDSADVEIPVGAARCSNLPQDLTGCPP